MIGIIAEFSPFHNGHKYFLEEVKRKNPNQPIVVVMSNEITQRGEFSLLSIQARAKIAIQYGADLVLELPFWRSNQAADFFAIGAVSILNNIGVDEIVCGSETADIQKIIEPQKKTVIQKDFKSQYGKLVMSEMMPNDILARAYYEAVQKINPKIKLDFIKRKGKFHGDSEINGDFKSATEIRKMILANENIVNDVPVETMEAINKEKFRNRNEIYKIIKHQINILSITELEKIMFVEEGIGVMLKKRINQSQDLESLEKAIKIKQYTQNKVRRMINSIYLNYTKEDNKVLQNEIDSIIIIDYNAKGQEILKIFREQIKEINLASRSIKKNEINNKIKNILK
jgi:cytidyltransferase-like protein